MWTRTNSWLEGSPNWSNGTNHKMQCTFVRFGVVVVPLGVMFFEVAHLAQNFSNTRTLTSLVGKTKCGSQIESW